jgi:hypothetical protein
MGAAAMTIMGPNEAEDPSIGNNDRPLYEFLGLNKFDVSALVANFDRMSKDKKGYVKVRKVMNHFGIGSSPYMERIFSLLFMKDLQKKATVNFREFVFIVWNFASIGRDLGLFVCLLACLSDFLFVCSSI